MSERSKGLDWNGGASPWRDWIDGLDECMHNEAIDDAETHSALLYPAIRSEVFYSCRIEADSLIVFLNGWDDGMVGYTFLNDSLIACVYFERWGLGLGV